MSVQITVGFTARVQAVGLLMVLLQKQVSQQGRLPVIMKRHTSIAV